MTTMRIQEEAARAAFLVGNYLHNDNAADKEDLAEALEHLAVIFRGDVGAQRIANYGGVAVVDGRPALGFATLRQTLLTIRSICDTPFEDLRREYGSEQRVFVAVIPSMIDAALDSQPVDDGSLDAAWRQAEAALPEGEVIAGLTPAGGGWYAHAYNAERERCDGIGNTPAEALLALAATLNAR